MKNIEFAIFKTGTHTDSKGRKREWTEQDLDDVVKSYNPQHHEAPLTLGHSPETNEPSSGWVESLYRKGDLLYARFKQVQDEMIEKIKNGLFKKVSAAFYPEPLGLQHVAMLGAVPPAVKGIPEIILNENIENWLMYEENFKYKESIKMDIEKKEVELDIKEVFEKNKKELMDMLKAEGSFYSEADMTELKKKTADQEIILKAAILKFENSNKELEKQKIQLFCEKNSKITPAMMEFGIVNFLHNIKSDVTEYQFSEKTKASPYEFVVNFIERFVPTVNFNELTAENNKNNLTKIEQKINEYEKTGMSYSEAVTAASKDFPMMFNFNSFENEVM